jgi:hypothetical protein
MEQSIGLTCNFRRTVLFLIPVKKIDDMSSNIARELIRTAIDGLFMVGCQPFFWGECPPHWKAETEPRRISWKAGDRWGSFICPGDPPVETDDGVLLNP